MRFRVLCLSGLVLLAVSCSSAPVRPAWYPPSACADCYQGTGEAADYATARKQALAGVCEDIRVVVESAVEDKRRHLLRQASENGEQSDRMEYEEVATVTSRSHARCVFEDLPVREMHRDEAAGRTYVLLRLGVADYRRFLARRTARLVLDVPAGTPMDTLSSELSDVLRSVAHPVTTAQDAPWEARVRFKPAVNEAVEGLKVATATASVQLVHVQSGKIAAEAAVDSLVARGYSVPDLLRKLERQAADGLSDVLATKMNSL